MAFPYLAVSSLVWPTPLKADDTVILAYVAPDKLPSVDSVFDQILTQAGALYKEQGIRPEWPYETLKRGEIVPEPEAAEAVSYVIPCESQLQDRDSLDDNGKMSRGIGQFQDATWADFSKESGITGSPDNAMDTLMMMLWAVEHGYISSWTCSRLTGIIKP